MDEPERADQGPHGGDTCALGMGMDGGYARCLVLFPSRMPGDVSCLPRPGGGPGQTAPNVFFVNPSDIYVITST